MLEIPESLAQYLQWRIPIKVGDSKPLWPEFIDTKNSEKETAA
jgi:hypothetical protein